MVLGLGIIVFSFLRLKKSDNKRLSAELEILTLKALKAATESDHLKSTFLATMSHELRTPLNAIIGFSELINEEPSFKKIVGFSKIIYASGNNLQSIVDDLFDITLIESGELKIVKKDFDLTTMLNDFHIIISAEQQKTKKGHIDLNLIIPPEGKNLSLYTDSSKLLQILVNLLKNAIKFTHQGHVRYGFEVEANWDKPQLKFFVEDIGIGIPEDKQEFIFNMFRQLDDSNTRTYGGTGIGLSVSKKLIELLGGKIWVESKVRNPNDDKYENEGGSTFYFTIPVERFDSDDKTDKTFKK